MGWILDVYKTFHPTDVNAAAVVTGKRPTASGIAGRHEATGRGLQYALREFFRHPEDVKKAGLEGGLEGKRVIVQGLGTWATTSASFSSKKTASISWALSNGTAPWWMRTDWTWNRSSSTSWSTAA